MSRRHLPATVAVAALVGLAGCTSFDGLWQRTTKSRHERDTTEESEEQWKVVGDEGRKGQDVEIDPDQWWRKYVMSEKARSIEENLGYE